MRLTTAGTIGVGLLVVLVAACIESSSEKDGENGPNGSSGRSRDSGSDPKPPEDLAPDSSPLVERSSLCETAATKSCNHGYSSIDECESTLLGTNARFIDALTKCV